MLCHKSESPGSRAPATLSPGHWSWAATAAYRFDLNGEDGGEFHIVLKDGKGEAGAGAPENPNTTIAMAASDFVGMATGTMNPMLAFMGGKLKVRGDMALAMKLQTLMQ